MLALLAACRAAEGAPTSGRIVLAAVPQAMAAADPANAALFQCLTSALEEGDDELAGRTLAGLRVHALTAGERELVAGAERVLRGRELVRGLELVLASEPGNGGEGSYTLVLVARSRAAEELRLRLPPCDLKRLRASMDARGFEGLEYESKTSTALADLRLAPGVEQRIELLSYELPLGRALGVRERWRMDTRSGEIDCGDEVLPAASVKVQGCERERLSPQVAEGPAPPAALAERLVDSQVPTPRELLELALRTGRDGREAALDALAPVVSELARSCPERVALAEPALRWLTQNRDIGPDPAGWARYLEARVAAAANAPVARGGLDLPARARDKREAKGAR